MTIAFQYWQRGPKEKMLAAGRAWFGDFLEAPEVGIQSGRDHFTYKPLGVRRSRWVEVVGRKLEGLGGGSY